MTQYSSYSYLFAANSQKEVSSIIKDKCISEEIENLNEILDSWKLASRALQKIESKEKGIAESCQTFDLSSELVETVKTNKKIQKTFSEYSFDIKLVELDKIIATQREILLDYADDLLDKIPDSPSNEDLVNFCLLPNQKVPLPEFTRINSKNYNFSSPSKDLRFLGGFIKKYLTMEDIDFTGVGGTPTHVISLFVGYGIPCMSAFEANGRIILHNGFHRAYALRKKGISKIPLLLKKIENPDLDFPDKVNDLKKDYLLNHTRPTLIKDFFNEDLVRIFKRKKRRKSVSVKWNSDEFSVDL